MENIFEAILGNCLGSDLVNKAMDSGLAFSKKLQEEDEGMVLPPIAHKALYDAAEKIKNDKLLDKLGVGDTATDEAIVEEFKYLLINDGLVDETKGEDRYALLGKFYENEEQVDPHVEEGNKKVDNILLELYGKIKSLYKNEEHEDVLEWFYAYLHQDFPLEEGCGGMSKKQKQAIAISKARKKGKRIRAKESRLVEDEEKRGPRLSKIGQTYKGEVLEDMGYKINYDHPTADKLKEREYIWSLVEGEGASFLTIDEGNDNYEVTKILYTPQRTREGKLTEQDDEDPSMVTGPAKKPYKDDSLEGDASVDDEPVDEVPDKEAPPEVEPNEAKITDKMFLGKSSDNFYYIEPSKEGEGKFQVIDQEGKIVFCQKDSEEAASNEIDFIIAAVREIGMAEVSSDIFLNFFVPAIEAKQKEEDEYEDEQEGEPPKEEEYPEEETPEGEVGKKERELTIKDSKLSEIKVVSDRREFDVQLKEDGPEFVTIAINGRPFKFGAQFAKMYKREGKMTDESIKGLALDALLNMPGKTFDELVTKEGKIPDFGLDKQDSEEDIIDKLTEAEEENYEPVEADEDEEECSRCEGLGTVSSGRICPTCKGYGFVPKKVTEAEGNGLRRPGPPIFNEQDKDRIRTRVETFMKEKATEEQLSELSTIAEDILARDDWEATLKAYKKIMEWGNAEKKGQRESLDEDETGEDPESIKNLANAILAAIDKGKWEEAKVLAQKMNSKTYMKDSGELGVREGNESFEELSKQAKKAIEDKDWKKVGELTAKASALMKTQKREPVGAGVEEGKIPDFSKDSEEEIVNKLIEDEDIEPDDFIESDDPDIEPDDFIESDDPDIDVGRDRKQREDF